MLSFPKRKNITRDFMNSQFLKAKAIWAKDKAKEMNVTCLFTAEFKKMQNLKLYITGSIHQS